MKKINLFFLLYIITTFSKVLAFEDTFIDIHGETNFSSSETQSLDTSIYIEYNLRLYEPDHGKWGLFLAGKVNPAYDHLGNEIKVDVFTVLGVDF
jgi:hypothetical protein